MGPLSALLRKELTEILGDRSSRRGGFIQGLVIVGVLGGLLPSSNEAAWLSGSATAVLFFGMLPGVPAAVVAADAIAGERERRTLPTLLASPIKEWTLLFGKWLAAVSYGTAIAVVSLLVGLGVVTFKAGAFAPAPVFLAGAVACGLASAALMASVAVIVSLQVSSARAAQQIASILSIVLVIGGSRLAAALGVMPTWPNVFTAAAIAMSLALVVLMIGRALFHREKLLDAR